MPASSGIPDVRLRLIAKDTRFQNPSAGGDRILIILPGNQSPEGGDIKADGVVDLIDRDLFVGIRLAAVTDSAPRLRADVNGDDLVDGPDIATFALAMLGA